MNDSPDLIDKLTGLENAYSGTHGKLEPSKLSHYETSERTAMFERCYFQLIRTGIRNCMVERYYIFTSDKVQSVQSV